MKIALFVTSAAGTYGGGRPGGVSAGAVLGARGAEVSFITNAKPVFYDDLKHFGHPGRVGVYLIPNPSD
jgi:hypothetical protein